MNQLSPGQIAVQWLQDYAFAVSKLIADRFVSQDEQRVVENSEEDLFVLVLPGVYEGSAFMAPMVRHLAHSNFNVIESPELGLNARDIPATAQHVMEFINANHLRRVVIVAHSKGGLIAQYAMQKLDPDFRIRHLIAISSPFRGSVYARWFPLPVRSVHEFSPTSPIMRDLLANDYRRNDITSIYATFDPHIPIGSELEGAHANVPVECAGHFKVLKDKRFLNAVTSHLERVIGT